MRPSDISRWKVSVDSWLDQGSVYGSAEEPGVNTVVVDTGALAAGFYDFTVITCGSGSHYITWIEHRNAINDDTLDRFLTGWLANMIAVTPINNWQIVANERLRVITEGAMGGIYVGNIYWSRRA